MTHLTQVDLPYELAANLRIRDSYDWHQRVWECFPGRDGQARDFLTRLDRMDAGFRLLIVSAVEPIRPEWCPPSAWCGTKRVPETYFSKGRYRFHLLANPTRKIAVEKTGGGFTKNGRREPLRTRDQLVQWIKCKGEQGGFVVSEETLRTLRRGQQYFGKKGENGLHSAVEFQGALRVTDAKLFHEAFIRGIGSAKAFGFGLLVLIPVA